MMAMWGTLAVMVVFALLMVQRATAERALCAIEQAEREEFAAYAVLDTVMRGRDLRVVAKRICTAVARHNACHEAALLVRDAEQRLRIVGSAGIDDLTERALNEWGERYARERRVVGKDRRASYTVTLGPMENYDQHRHYGALGCRQVLMMPLWSESGVMLGALAAAPKIGSRVDLERVLPPLEALAGRLARAMESAQLSEQLQRAEKMAGLGQLARGVAHELNNPLTAVMGYAELMVATAQEPRLRDDAQSILRQAVRMKETVESLLEFWRPASTGDASVDIGDLLAGLAEQGREEFNRRSIALQLESDVETHGAALVRGHEERLRQLFEHLLTHAAEAVGESVATNGAAHEDGNEPTGNIRITLARESGKLQVVISDTGQGFEDPSHIFDPFHAERSRPDAAESPWAASYGVVRQHGGEISAFNLYPHGSAVVVELPLATVVIEEEVEEKLAA
jgi:signal transduction histidine kinase